jgi:hypothetical protein
MNSLATEMRVTTDLRALLTAAGITSYQLESLRTGTATGVGIGVDSLEDSLPGGTIPTGMATARFTVDCSTEIHDDATLATVQALAGSVRECLLTDDIVSRLNVVSSYVTYHGLDMGPADQYVEARRAHIAWSGSLTIRPGNATTTSTTTTTT